MSSKEALEILFASYNFDVNYHDLIIAREKLEQALERLEKLEIANKNNEGIVRENTDLINRNLELQDELKRCQDTIKKWMNDHKKLIIENGKMKKALDIYKTKYIHNLYLRRSKDVEEYNKMIDKLSEFDLYDYLTKEEYEIFKEVYK